MVSPFENPFPTRGRGPWTPWGGSEQALVSSHTIYRPRCTDRQLLGVGILFCHRITFWEQTKTFAIPESQRLTLSRALPRNPDDLI